MSEQQSSRDKVRAEFITLFQAALSVNAARWEFEARREEEGALDKQVALTFLLRDTLYASVQALSTLGVSQELARVTAILKESYLASVGVLHVFGIPTPAGLDDDLQRKCSCQTVHSL
jgi:hypothetical protein